jgi:rod shape-determining protein MreC
MDYSPPPLFKQGPSALVRLVVFVMLAVGMLFTDAHFHTLQLVRQVVGTTLYPLQRLALLPRDLTYDTLNFFVSGAKLRAENTALAARNLNLGLAASRTAELSVENEHLRALLQLTQRAPITPIPAEIQYDTRDPFSQKVIIDHGTQSGIVAGSPVVNELGLVGQVTRVFPLQAEVTLLTDRDEAVPVQIVRTGVRSVIYGTANGDLLDLRFVPTSADVKPGDELVTGGLDGVYPAGLPVARVLRVERQSDSAFAKVVAIPIAQIRGVRQLLVLHYQEAIPPNPLDAAASQAAAKPASKRDARGTRGATDSAGSAAAAGTAPAAASGVPVTAAAVAHAARHTGPAGQEKAGASAPGSAPGKRRENIARERPQQDKRPAARAVTPSP